MYIIIVGCGRMGANLAADLSMLGNDVVVVDREKSAFDRLGMGFNGMTVLGTGIDEDILKKAGIEQANALIAMTDQDNVNIMVAQVAKDIFHVPKVIARIYNPEREYAYKEFGLETINPTAVGIALIKSAIIPGKLHRHHLPFLGSGDMEVIDLKVTENLAGKDISWMQVPHKFKIFGVIRGTETLIPNGEFVLAKGDVILGAVRLDAIPTIEDLLGESGGKE